MPGAVLSGRRVLVTGGAGFIGSHLVEALVEDNEVRVLDDFSTGSRTYLPSEVTVFEGDIRDEEVVDLATDNVDLIFHDAAMVDVQASVQRPIQCTSVNINATTALLERARTEDARFVFASSAAIYGPPERIPIREADAKTPDSPYGLSKLTGDHYCRLYHDLYDVETVALRYFNVYGPRHSGGNYSGVISVFLEQALAGEPITVHGDGSQTRDFVHVDDVVRANLLAAAAGVVGEGYNVGTGESVSVLELAQVVKAVTGSDSEIVHVEPRAGDIQRSRADVSKVETQLGFEAEVPLNEGLTTLIEQT